METLTALLASLGLSHCEVILASSGLSEPEHLLSLSAEDLELALTAAGLAAEEITRLQRWVAKPRSKAAETRPCQLLTGRKAALLLPQDCALKPNRAISKELERLQIRLFDIQQERVDAQEAKQLLLSIDVPSYRRILQFIALAQETLRSL
jgi:hypothetical protein